MTAIRLNESNEDGIFQTSQNDLTYITLIEISIQFEILVLYERDDLKH